LTFWTVVLFGWAQPSLHALTPAGQDVPPPAQEAPRPKEQQPEVTDIDIEDLMKVQVTSPGRKEQTLTDVPAAIYVVRGEDIKRMGATSLPEALRGVPGMQVARTRSSTWAVSVRGFTDSSSNKMLVLIDGRSVYSPLHSGVFWDVQDTFLEDVERIEVIRGPGGSLWGSNAINGVVNIITKRAEDTQGAVVTAGGGTEERAFGAVRYGFKAADDLFVRVYAKYFDRDNAADGLDPEEDARDGWYMARAGFRSDWKATERDRVTITGDGYGGQVKEHVNNPSLSSSTGMEVANDRIDLRGGHLLVRWDHVLDPTSDLSVQLYYDQTYRSSALFTDELRTGDLDIQHRFRFGDAHDINWGLGYRIYRSEFSGDFAIQIDPSGRTDDLISAFVQDEIALFPQYLRLTVGSKFEHNDYSGFEYQPSGRLAWTLDDRHMVWASASRAVRTPSIIDVDLRINAFVIPGPTPVVSSFFGDRGFHSEELIAYETGYRVRPADFLSADLALFYNRYDRLRSIEAGASFLESDPPPQHLIFPFFLANGLDASSWGVELSANLQAATAWLIQVSYSHLRLNFSDDSGEGRDPRDTVWIRSALDLSPEMSLDLVGRYVSRLPAFDLDSYIETDLRLAWRNPARNLEAAIVGQNLIHESHPEFQAEASRGEIQRSVYLTLTWNF
jgi:iron complex outermembrane receptor protein